LKTAWKKLQREGVEKSNERIARSKSWRENNKFNQNEDAGKLYGIEIVEISSQNGHSCANTHNLAQIAIKIKTFDGFFYNYRTIKSCRCNCKAQASQQQEISICSHDDSS